MSVPMTIEDFNSNFVVRIVDYNNVVDSSDIKVVFEVKCNTNNRVGVFISEVDTTALIEAYTSTEVIAAAWDDVKTTVNSWAVVNIANDVLALFTPLSTTADISLTDFNTNFTVHINRYELYPRTQPSSWCIGFSVHNTISNQTLYTDGTVPIQDFCNDVLCVDVATAVWDTLKQRVCLWAATEMSRSTLLNTIYNPTAFTL